ncbi:hypothetical protein B0O80DRAFT_269965 [Mortierella sp. GBAus27b]|nr:hypothetical protein B0O80DRAFT_269965 [Mortierella sp. GBAus27b]
MLWIQIKEWAIGRHWCCRTIVAICVVQARASMNVDLITFGSVKSIPTSTLDRKEKAMVSIFTSYLSTGRGHGRTRQPKAKHPASLLYPRHVLITSLHRNPQPLP